MRYSKRKYRDVEKVIEVPAKKKVKQPKTLREKIVSFFKAI